MKGRIFKEVLRKQNNNRGYTVKESRVPARRMSKWEDMGRVYRVPTSINRYAVGGGATEQKPTIVNHLTIWHSESCDDMVAIVQLVERQIVDLVVVGSSPSSHPIKYHI